MIADDKDLPRFVTKKWTGVYDQSGRENYYIIKGIGIKTPMLRADLYDFSDAYIVVKGTIAVTEERNMQKCKKK